MIELERVADVRDPSTGELWSDETNEHVISCEDGQYWVRDTYGERGPVRTFEQAFDIAFGRWGGQVTLVPANRLRDEIEEGRTGEIGDFLLEYLAE
jgi:hypothetical protein